MSHPTGWARLVFCDRGHVDGPDTKLQGGFEMKRITLIAGLASMGALAAVLWTLPVAASTGCSAGCTTHDARSGREERFNHSESSDEDTASTSVPEPGTLALLGLGLSGLGLTGLGRKRTKK
jgi:PEP-CTERM motif-containing protein